MLGCGNELHFLGVGRERIYFRGRMEGRNDGFHRVGYLAAGYLICTALNRTCQYGELVFNFRTGKGGISLDKDEVVFGFFEILGLDKQLLI